MAPKFKKINQVDFHKMVTIFGQSGSGKTSFINTLTGKVLIIDVDKGLSSVNSELDADVAECDTFDDVFEALNHAGDYDCVVIDHITRVQELCYDKVMAKYNIENMLFNHFGEASKYMKHLVDVLVELSVKDIKVLVLAQEKVFEGKNVKGETELTMVVPSLMDSAWRYLVENSRVIAHSEVDNKPVIVNGKKKYKTTYQLRLSGDPYYKTKVTRNAKYPIPSVVTDFTLDDLRGLVDGTTQKKRKKETNKTEGEQQ